MGSLISMGFAIVGLAGACVTSFIARDAYACLPRVQAWLIRIAASHLPDKLREQSVEQWTADIADLPPSQIVRTCMAADCIRGAILIAHREKMSVTWLLSQIFICYAWACFWCRTRITEAQSLSVQLQLSLDWRNKRARASRATARALWEAPYDPTNPMYTKYGQPARLFLDDWREYYLTKALKADEQAANSLNDEGRLSWAETAEFWRLMALNVRND